VAYYTTGVGGVCSIPNYRPCKTAIEVFTTYLEFLLVTFIGVFLYNYLQIVILPKNATHTI